MKISDLIKADQQAEFRNDVQLDAYSDPAQNLSLLNAYLFTKAVPGYTGGTQRVASLKLLQLLREAYLNPKAENRIVAIANYGHGKSHFALAIANYFGRTADSQAFKVVMERIEQVELDKPTIGSLRSFKESKGAFLVIRLRGDQPGSLREQFIQRAEAALREQSQTSTASLDFWFDQALPLFSNLDAPQIERANTYLEQYQVDLPLFLHHLQQRNESIGTHATYDIARELGKILLNITPDFGGEVSLQGLVNDLANRYCGYDKPFGGILILYDEFTLYIRNYGMRPNTAGELQQLLQGVEDQKGQVVFLAFAQQDPITIADSLGKGHLQVDNLKHQLGRLPSAGKYQLYSLIEGVIDAYLKQEPKAWAEFEAMPYVKGYFTQATTSAYDSFQRRYSTELQWSSGDFRQKITQGCFPLHPLTTALLCNLDFSNVGGEARTILGFVSSEVGRKRNEAVMIDEQINWILPISLVDFFGEQLSSTHYIAYENAQSSLGEEGPEIAPKILKAMLLQTVAGLALNSQTQEQWLAQAVGASLDSTKVVLKTLRKSRSLFYDEYTKTYRFWPTTANPKELTRLLNAKMIGLPLHWGFPSTLNTFTRSLSRINLGEIGVSVPWGHADDWQAQEYIFTREEFTIANLRKAMPFFTLTTKGIQEGVRGLLIWALAQSEEDVTWFHENATAIIDATAQGQTPIPQIVVLPHTPQATLIEAFQRLKGLHDFTKDEQTQVGPDLYRHELSQAAERLQGEIESLRGGNQNQALSVARKRHLVRVPSQYRTGVDALPSFTLQRILEESYRLAYRFGPPEFFPIYKNAHAQTREASRKIALTLSNPELRLNDAIQAEAFTKNLAESFLVTKWGILSKDYKVQPPTSKAVEEAWNYLNATFTLGAGDLNLGKVLLTLLHPPYGFDYNTLVLLFGAWYGVNVKSLQAYKKGAEISQPEFRAILANKPKEFLVSAFIENVVLKRTPPRDIENELLALLKTIETTHNWQQGDAETIISEVQARLSNVSIETREMAMDRLKRLREDLNVARDYDEQAWTLATNMETAKDVNKLMDFYHQVRRLPAPKTVKITAPAPSVLDAKFKQYLDSLTENTCARYETLTDITQVGLHRQKLEELKERLSRENQSKLAGRVDAALLTLQAHYERLSAEAQDAPLRARIEMMKPNAPLTELHAFCNELQGMTNLSRATAKLRDERSNMLQTAIMKVETEVTQMIERVATLTTVEAVRNWRTESDRSRNRWADSRLMPQMDVARQHVEQIEPYLNTLVKVNAQAIRYPDDAQRATQELAKLAVVYDGLLSPVQHSLLKNAQQRVQGAIVQLQQEAQTKLRNISDLVRQNANPTRLIKELQHVPAFLSDTEQSQWHSLQQEVQLRIDSDLANQIEAKFREITDPHQQNACLQRLQAIVEKAQSNRR